jgi:hypothetical protein
MRMLALTLPLIMLGPLSSGPQMATVAPAAVYRAASSGFESEGSAAQEVVALEKRTWETAQRRDSGAYAALLSDDSALVNEEGVSNKKQAVDGLNGLTIERYRLADIRLHGFSPHALLSTYQVNVKLGGQASEIVSHRSSLWVKRQGRWLNGFYQASDSK